MVMVREVVEVSRARDGGVQMVLMDVCTTG